jgi:hypothetical protein
MSRSRRAAWRFQPKSNPTPSRQDAKGDHKTESVLVLNGLTLGVFATLREARMQANHTVQRIQSG